MGWRASSVMEEKLRFVFLIVRFFGIIPCKGGRRHPAYSEGQVLHFVYDRWDELCGNYAGNRGER